MDNHYNLWCELNERIYMMLQNQTEVNLETFFAGQLWIQLSAPIRNQFRWHYHTLMADQLMEDSE